MQTHLLTVKFRLEIDEDMKMTFLCNDRMLFINRNKSCDEMNERCFKDVKMYNIHLHDHLFVSTCYDSICRS